MLATLDALATHPPDSLLNFGWIFNRPDGDQELTVLGHLAVQFANHLCTLDKIQKIRNILRIIWLTHISLRSRQKWTTINSYNFHVHYNNFLSFFFLFSFQIFKERKKKAREKWESFINVPRKTDTKETFIHYASCIRLVQSNTKSTTTIFVCVLLLEDGRTGERAMKRALSSSYLTNYPSRPMPPRVLKKKCTFFLYIEYLSR